MESSIEFIFLLPASASAVWVSAVQVSETYSKFDVVVFCLGRIDDHILLAVVKPEGLALH